MGFKLKEVGQLLPQINDSAAQIDFLINLFFSNEDFDVVELFNADNMEPLQFSRPC